MSRIELLVSDLGNNSDVSVVDVMVEGVSLRVTLKLGF